MPREMTMTTATLKQSQTAPPQPTAMAVRSHRKMLEIERDALKAAGPALAMASALGDLGAKVDLAALHAKLAALQFEIDCNDSAVELARSQDQAADAAWRASIQELPAEEIIEGITKDSCCRRCVPGSYCAISGSVPEAAGTCSHPILSQHLQYRDEFGKRHFRYADNAQAAKNFAAASRKLKVSS